MKNLFHRLLLIIAGSTQKELAAQIRYLKVENEILRSKLPPRVAVATKERNKLVKFGSKLGKALNELVTIVHPDTLRRWIREAGRVPKRTASAKGRPRTNDEIRELILMLARENDWGYTRILGELRKLGIQAISRNTVKNILKANGLDPGPKRGAGTWDEFLRIHAATLWQCDFFSKKVLTVKGYRDLFILVFLHVESRRVVVSPSTFNPNEAWVTGQAREFVSSLPDLRLDAQTIMHDRDTKFTTSFDEIFSQAKVDVVKSAFRSPNTMAYVERFIQTLKHECLQYFIVFGKEHIDHLLSEMVSYYHEERPHQAKENNLLLHLGSSKASPKRKKKKVKIDNDRVVRFTDIRCRERLGGLLKHYYQKAA